MIPSETSSPRAKKTFPLGAFLTSLVAMTTLVGLILHLMGHSSRTSYLEALGIPAELFLQTPEQHIILGYHILVGSLFTLKETWRPTTPHGREGLILAPCKVNPRAFFPSGVICVSRARVSSL